MQRRLKEIFKAAAKKAVLLPLTAFILSGCGTTGGTMGPGRQEPVNDLAPVSTAAPRMIEPEKPFSYEQSLFEMNGEASTTATARVKTEMTRQQKLGVYMDTFCVKPVNTSDWGLHFQDMWTVYPDVAGLTLLGKPLPQQALALNVTYCDLPVFPAGFGGQYLPSLDAVVLPKSGNDLRLPLVLSHEVVHATQHKNGELDYAYSWDIESRTRHTMATEGAAFTVEFMVAFEAKIRGKQNLWEHLQNGYGPGIFSDAEMYKTIEEKYASAVISGKTHEAALTIAAFHAFHRVFENKDWTEFYLDQTLKNYLDDIATGHMGQTVETSQYGQKRVDRAGIVGDSGSFTQGASLPTLEKLLSRNIKMKWAFEAAEIARYAKAHGTDSLIVADMRFRARENKNPYLDLDFARVSKRLAAETLLPADKAKHRLAYEVMDAMVLDMKRSRVSNLRVA